MRTTTKISQLSKSEANHQSLPVCVRVCLRNLTEKIKKKRHEFNFNSLYLFVGAILSGKTC